MPSLRFGSEARNLAAQGHGVFASPRVVRLAAVLLATGVLAGCVPVLMGGAVVGTTAVATDRRTAGMQLEDQSIELRIRNLVSNTYGEQAHVTPASYNGTVLLVGAAADAAIKERIGRIAEAVENVKAVVNNLEVGPGRTLSVGANDSWISGQVRTALLGTSDLASNAFAITTYRSVVYLQGRVTKREGDVAARVASSIKGVAKVVTLFEYISESEARQTPALTGSPDAASSTAPAAPDAGQPSNPPPSSSGGAEAIAIPVPAAP